MKAQGSSGQSDKRPRHKNQLERLVGSYARDEGLAPGRVRNWISYMAIVGALERAVDGGDSPLFWFKGGLTIEVRVGNPARGTQDVDVVFRLGTDDDDEVLNATLEEAFAAPYCDFGFEVKGVRRVGQTVYRDTKVSLTYGGRPWGTVKLEISPPEGSATDPERIPALPLEFAGLEGPQTLPCLPLRYQIAQKLHAVSERFPDKENDRERDLIDVLLVEELIEDLAATRHACLEVFDLRAKQTWPPTIVAEPLWEESFAATATRLGFPITDVHEAIARVHDLIARIDAA